jgi:hypothetical protein
MVFLILVDDHYSHSRLMMKQKNTEMALILQQWYGMDIEFDEVDFFVGVVNHHSHRR